MFLEFETHIFYEGSYEICIFMIYFKVNLWFYYLKVPFVLIYDYFMFFKFALRVYIVLSYNKPSTFKTDKL